MTSEDEGFSEELRRELSLAKARLVWDERSGWDAFWRRRRDHRRLARIAAAVTALVIGSAGLALVLPLRSTGENVPRDGGLTLTVTTRIDTGSVLRGVAASGDSVWVVGADASSYDGYLVGFSDEGTELARTRTTRVASRLVVDPRGVLVPASVARFTTTRYSRRGRVVYDLKGIDGTIAALGRSLWGTARGHRPDTAAIVAYDLATRTESAHIDLRVGVHDLAVAANTVFAITTSPQAQAGRTSPSLVSVSGSGTSPVMSDVQAGVLIPAADGVWVVNDQWRACLASPSGVRCLSRPMGRPIASTTAGLWMVGRRVLTLVDPGSGSVLASAPLPDGGPDVIFPQSVATSPDGNSIWIAARDGFLVQVAVS